MANYLITGASSGIGQALARACTARGHAVALVARREERLAEIVRLLKAEGGQAIAYPGDVRHEDQVQTILAKAWEEMEGLDVIIANAGLGILGPFEKMKSSDISHMFSVNVMGAVHLFRASIPMLEQAGKGHLVAVASIVGKMGYAGMSAYCATKFALVGLMEGLAGELKTKNIQTTVICPGEVKTEFFETADRDAMPSASKLIRPLTAKQVAETTLKAIEKKRHLVLLPFSAKIFIRFHDFFPSFSRWLFYRTSRFLK